jgi:hypothetical protein
VHEVGPGTLIADRYAVSHRLQQHPRWERWAAHDTTLGRDVVILTFASGTPAAAAAVDAARRAAAVTEPRLVRVLDIVTPPSSAHSPDAATQAGNDDVAELCAIVEEPVERSRSLTRILEQGGLPADEARRITGEAAKALDAAAARGLRHIVLTPRNVLVLPDGAVRVRGVAVEAALLGLEDTPAAVGARLDATALVGIGYAALTGRWPLSGADAGLPRAPIVGGTVVAADELGADACLDLDRLARAAFVEHAGPSNAAEVLAGLQPWPNGPTVDLWGDRRSSGDSSTGDPSLGASTVGGSSATRQGDGSAPGNPADDTAETPGRGPNLAAAQQVSSDPGAMAGGTPGGESGAASDPASGAALGPASGAALGPASGAALGPASGAALGPASGAALGASAAASAASVSAAMTKGARGVGSALGAAGTAAAQAASRLGERARHTVDRLSTRAEPVAGDAPPAAGASSPVPTTPVPTTSAPTTPAPTPLSAAAPPAPAPARPSGPRPSRPGSTSAGRPRVAAPRTLRAPDTIREDATLASVLTPVDSPLEDAVPLVPITGEFGRDESRLALAIVAGLVVLLAVLGMWGLPKLTSVGLPNAPGAAAGATSKATGTAKPGSPAVTGAAAGGALTPVAIIGAATFDASAGQVASSSAPKGYDGDVATMWRSKWYSNDKFGGLKVPGIGYVVDLGQQTEVRRVTVTVPVAQDITVYVANRASLDGATSIGSSAGKSGELVFDAPAGPIASGQLVIVLVTKLGPDGSGKFRAQVSEMAVSR